ncbi:MAG: tRNA-(ms[2]io[6]A)-hydroxylase [Pirellulales bacterium]|nr:tRNA-(ms[2]io[6]A)-hydroxylase [Pirellulales bacterium]
MTLGLATDTDAAWLDRVKTHLDEILIDHAHCERKAAATAMNLIMAYTEDLELVREMSEIVNEELEHFGQVLDILKRRGIRFRRIKPGHYGRELNDLARRQEPHRAVDRLLIAGLIEARSCERFCLLRDGIDDKELAEFYGSLFASEARHHATYTRLAKQFAPADEVETRLAELTTQEAEIIGRPSPLVKMHSC